MLRWTAWKSTTSQGIPRLKAPNCPVCDFSSIDRKQVQNHWVENHRDNHSYSSTVRSLLYCPQCDQAFFKKAHLVTHLKNAHNTDVPARECPICNEEFIRTESVFNHLQHVHVNGKYRCSKGRCAVGTGDRHRKSELHYREYVKTNEDSYIRRHAPARENVLFDTKAKAELDDHIKSAHSGKKEDSTCHICAKTFKYQLSQAYGEAQ